jgi:hypothetical protein
MTQNKTRKPAAERSARHKADLLRAGGRRLTMNLTPSDCWRLLGIRQRRGITSDAEAIRWALERALRAAKPRVRKRQVLVPEMPPLDGLG